jgi:hypothetical protein
MTFTNAVSSNVASGTTFTFTVYPVKNPFSAKPKTGFYISTTD